MSKVVKFYYTRPLSFLEVAIVPIRETVAVPQQKTRMSEQYTIAAVYDEEAKTIKFGLATCVPTDHFVKKIGREIAEKRAETEPFFEVKDFDGTFADFRHLVIEVGTNKEEELLYRKYNRYMQAADENPRSGI